MGFFSRRPGPVHSAQTQPTTMMTAMTSPLPPFQTPPPAYLQPLLQYPVPPYYEQQQQQQPSGVTYGDDALSEEDLDAIQTLIDRDAIADQFSNIIAGIDGEQINDNEEDYTITVTEEPNNVSSHIHGSTRALISTTQALDRRRPPQARPQKVTIWTKVSYYSNSRLPADLPPLRVYIPTWPLICLAAQYSANVYKSPTSPLEREVFVSADARLGTKAMVMKSVPCDDKKTLVFAIRGTSMFSLKDWNINLNTAPVSPAGFLDDEGNLCHAGFLRVAKAMVKPIAMRLRTLLEENPSRASCSLVITGHSAGGAVAALLYSHMLSSIESELSILTGCFKRVHCITFGSPPVTLLPLTKPADRRFNKSLFFSFMNEGDPVVRAEKAYVRSLIDLLSSPFPTARIPARQAVAGKNTITCLQQSVSKIDLTLSKLDLTKPKTLAPLNPLNSKKHNLWNFSCSALPAPLTLQSTQPLQTPASSSILARHWPVPTATLSNAGRLVLLRVPHQETQKRKGQQLQRTTSVRWERDNLSKVSAHTITDEQLRSVIFGDPSTHAMQVYLRRVDMLALKAVTARN